MSGEFDLIDWIVARQRAAGEVRLAGGDDLAVLEMPGGILAGCDQVLEGVHYDPKTTDPGDIGRKAVNRNLSDVAAMGGRPTAMLLTLTLNRESSIEFARAIYLGAEQAGEAFGCAIVGGDVASWAGPTAVAVSILARPGPGGIITRSGARPGDFVHVSGALGGSILGRHLRFTPRVELALSLVGSFPLHAMIDLSDGLSRDAAHIARASGVSITLQAEALPVHQDAHRLARQTRRDPLEHALHDGEDYELLIVSPVDQLPDCRLIGRVEPGEGLFLHWPANGQGSKVRLEPKAWEHTLRR